MAESEEKEVALEQRRINDVIFLDSWILGFLEKEIEISFM